MYWSNEEKHSSEACILQQYVTQNLLHHYAAKYVGNVYLIIYYHSLLSNKSYIFCGGWHPCKLRGNVWNVKMLLKLQFVPFKAGPAKKSVMICGILHAKCVCIKYSWRGPTSFWQREKCDHSNRGMVEPWQSPSLINNDEMEWLQPMHWHEMSSLWSGSNQSENWSNGTSDVPFCKSAESNTRMGNLSICTTYLSVTLFPFPNQCEDLPISFLFVYNVSETSHSHFPSLTRRIWIISHRNVVSCDL